MNTSHAAPADATQVFVNMDSYITESSIIPGFTHINYVITAKNLNNIIKYSTIYSILGLIYNSDLNETFAEQLMNIGTPREKSYLVENIPRVRDLRLLYEFTMNLKAVLEPIVVANIATAQSMTPPERGLHATSTYLHIVFPEIANHGLWRFVCSCSKVRRLYNTESDISKYIEEIYAAIYKNKMGGEKARRVYIDIVYNKGYYNTHHLQSDIHKQIIARAVVPAPQ